MNPDWFADTKLTIVDRLHQLNCDEQQVVLEVVNGLIAGRGIYGGLNLDTDTRDFAKERWEENRDSIVYAACEAIKKRRGAK